MLRLDYGVSRAARFLRRIQRSRPPPQEDEWTKRDHGPRRDAGAVREVPQHVVAEELIVHQIGPGRAGAGSLVAGKRRAIELACCAWTDLSQARIAAQVGWTQPYVGQIRAQLNTTIELPDQVVGVDGRRRPAKRSAPS